MVMLINTVNQLIVICICCNKTDSELDIMERFLDKIRKKFKNFNYILNLTWLNLFHSLFSCINTQVYAKLMTEYYGLTAQKFFTLPFLPLGGKRENIPPFTQGKENSTDLGLSSPQLSTSSVFAACWQLLQVSEQCRDFSMLPLNWNGNKRASAVLTSDIYIRQVAKVSSKHSTQSIRNCHF